MTYRSRSRSVRHGRGLVGIGPHGGLVGIGPDRRPVTCLGTGVSVTTGQCRSVFDKTGQIKNLEFGNRCGRWWGHQGQIVGRIALRVGGSRKLVVVLMGLHIVMGLRVAILGVSLKLWNGSGRCGRPETLIRMRVSSRTGLLRRSHEGLGREESGRLRVGTRQVVASCRAVRLAVAVARSGVTPRRALAYH